MQENKTQYYYSHSTNQPIVIQPTVISLRPIKENLQKATRKIMFKKYNHPTATFFNQLKVLNLEQKNLTIGGFMCKVKNNMVPKTLHNLKSKLKSNENISSFRRVLKQDLLDDKIG